MIVVDLIHFLEYILEHTECNHSFKDQLQDKKEAVLNKLKIH